MESVSEWDFGVFYYSEARCQKYCDDWYGTFRHSGFAETLGKVTEGKIFAGYKCICHASKEILDYITRMHGKKSADKFRRHQLLGWGRRTRDNYPEIDFNSRY